MASNDKKSKKNDPKTLMITYYDNETYIDEETGAVYLKTVEKKRPATQKEIADHNFRSARQIQNRIDSKSLIKLGADFDSEAAKGTALYRDEVGIL